MRSRHFDVVAEDLVEADLERADPGALAFPPLQRGDVLLAAVAGQLQVVELLVVPGPHRVAVRELPGRPVYQRARKLAGQVREQVEPLRRPLEQRDPPAPL